MEPDAGSDNTYKGDAGPQQTCEATSAGDNWNPAAEVAPAACRPDPSDFSACGGDVVGQWRLAVLCFADGLQALREECPEVTQQLCYQYRMLLDIKSNGNYTVAQTTDAKQSITMPKSCDAECSRFGADDTDDSDGSTQRTTMVGDSCVTEATFSDSDSLAGVWQVNGTELTTMSASEPETREFCVRGNVLTLKGKNMLSGTAEFSVFERL
jgi:hypothetical protein